MKLTPQQLTDLTDVAQKLSSLIAQTQNLGIREREISLTVTKLEEGELWLERFITSVPGVQAALHEHNKQKS